MPDSRVRITTITSVTPYGDNLSVVKVMVPDGEEQVIANRDETGNFRWSPDEVAAYVPVGMLLPVDVLKTRGYFDVERERGLLDGGQRNRTKMRKMGPDKLETHGLLFKVDTTDKGDMVITRDEHDGVPATFRKVEVGDDVTDFFGIELHGGA